MKEDKKCACGIPLNDKTTCKCDPKACIHCCKCTPDCKCGCQDKTKKKEINS